MEIGIINRGRGPEIAGTRITVYTIMDYLQLGWHHTTIAAALRISSNQVNAAIEYIEQNKEEVSRAYQEIVARANSRTNPPEVEAKRLQSSAKLQAELARLKAERELRDKSHAGNPG